MIDSIARKKWMHTVKNEELINLLSFGIKKYLSNNVYDMYFKKILYLTKRAVELSSE